MLKITALALSFLLPAGDYDARSFRATNQEGSVFLRVPDNSCFYAFKIVRTNLLITPLSKPVERKVSAVAYGNYGQCPKDTGIRIFEKGFFKISETCFQVLGWETAVHKKRNSILPLKENKCTSA